MNAQLWIAVGFTSALLFFLMLTFFTKEKLSPAQYNTLRFITALCGSFAGGFVAGEAIFQLDSEIAEGTKVAIQGTAGFALFFTVWFTYGSYQQVKPGPLATQINASLPSLSLEQALLSLGEAFKVTIKLTGFTPEELATHLPAVDIRAKKLSEAISQLRATAGGVPLMDIEKVEGVFHLTKKD